MSQCRTMSLVEAIANVLVGYVLAVLLQLAGFPLFGVGASLAGNLALGALFTPPRSCVAMPSGAHSRCCGSRSRRR